MLRKRKSLLQLQEEVIQDELEKTKVALDCAYSNFENATDPDLIDCSIYELKAAQQRYKVLLKQAKFLYNSKSKMATEV
ncbi:MAG: YaaL family protein [Velocimicrobium sp.]